MPQPLKWKTKTGSVLYHLAGPSFFQTTSALSTAYANAILSWSAVEASMLKAFVSMLGGPDETASALFISLETQAAKSQAIRALAQSTLNLERQKLLAAILAVTKAHQKARDKLVHWLPGSSSEHPNCLVMIDPRKFVQSGRMFHHSLVYTTAEIETIAANNGKVALYWSRFGWMVEAIPAFEPAKLYEQLCGEPEIQEKLSRQASADLTDL